MDTILRLVLQQASRARCRVHLGARHAASPAAGPAHGLCLEIDAADDAHQHCCRRSVAVYAGGGCALDRLLHSRGGSLRRVWPDAGRTESTWYTSISIRGLTCM